MEIRTLRYFLTVAQEKNMTRAAEILHITQPTLSKTLRSLEDNLGKKLFQRHKFGISLTEEGLLLYDRAKNLVTLADKIEQEFLSMDDIIGGELFLGLAESHQIGYLIREIRKLKKTCPRLNYHIVNGDTWQIMEKLDKGLIDFAVLSEKPSNAKYNYIPFPEPDVWGVVMRNDSPLAKKDVILVDDLIGLPILTSELSWNNHISRWCGERIHELHMEGTFTLSYNTSAFVKEGMGYQLTFAGLVNTSLENGLVFRPLYPRLESRFLLIWNESQSLTPLANLFLLQVKESFAVI